MDVNAIREPVGGTRCHPGKKRGSLYGKMTFQDGILCHRFGPLAMNGAGPLAIPVPSSQKLDHRGTRKLLSL